MIGTVRRIAGAVIVVELYLFRLSVAASSSVSVYSCIAEGDVWGCSSDFM
jgi:hypothetical protein